MGGIPVTTSATTYKVRITPKTHANMPAVPGASYATTGTVTSFTSTNSQTGTDSGSATVTVDNGSPADATSAGGTAASTQVALNWTNPTDTDYDSIVVLRRASSAVANVPAEGATYTNGATIGTATVVCVVASPTETCTDTGLTNGTAYHYKLFSKDSNGNYAAGTVPTGSPFTPSATTFAVTSSAGTNGTITPNGTTNVAQGSSQLYTLNPDSGYDVATLTVDSVSIATSTSYTFTNVQTTHTISATFSLLPVTHTITSSAGSGGTITPLGATSVADAGSQTYTITPDNGYNISTLVVDSIGISTSTSYTFSNVTADHTISATFVLIPPPPGSFSIVATAGANGTVTPSGATNVTQGNSQAYTITPNSGYYTATLTVDSVSIATSTSYTFTNVQAGHTIDATFSALATPEPDTSAGVSVQTTVTFTGKAFPDGKISVINKELREEKLTSQNIVILPDGSFTISFVGVLQSMHSFGLLIKDALGRSSQTKFYLVDTTSQELTTKNIVVPPTIDVLNGQVSRGKNVTIVGSATPDYAVFVELNGIIATSTIARKDGGYRFELPTGVLEFGRHTVRTKQSDLTNENVSGFSISRNFIVSNLTVTQTDFNADGKVDIKDWSIFLARFTSKDPDTRKSIDLTGDGKVDISDFSIFIKTIRKK